jgi:hypothetical protein
MKPEHCKCQYPFPRIEIAGVVGERPREIHLELVCPWCGLKRAVAFGHCWVNVFSGTEVRHAQA